MPSFSMRPAKYFYDKPLLKYLDPKTVLIYLLHPVQSLCVVDCFLIYVVTPENDENGFPVTFRVFTVTNTSDYRVKGKLI